MEGIVRSGQVIAIAKSKRLDQSVQQVFPLLSRQLRYHNYSHNGPRKSDQLTIKRFVTYH